MAGLFLVRTDDAVFAEHALAAARAQFERHGFSSLTERTLPGWHLIHAPPILGGPPSLLIDGTDFVAVAGTVCFDGKIGADGLAALLAHAALPHPDWSRLSGQFVALISRQGRTFLLTDFFGAFQIFHDEAMRLFSTTLLAAAQALPRLRFDAQSVYEFAFNVVPIGNDSVFEELALLGPEHVAELTEQGCILHPIAKPLPTRPVAMKLADRLEAHRHRLGAVMRHHVAHFGDQVQCALSGGLDSRLVMAALRAEGCRPHLFVYGPADSADVRIARQIAAAEGYPIDWRDKEADPIEPEDFPAQVERNFQRYDALPNFGELFENGANGAALDARHAGGALSASGGCGEIYRNFFFLPDGPATTASVARSFFARFIRQDVTDGFDERHFLGTIDRKIRTALALPLEEKGRVPRAHLEQIYPRVRCRALFGREISIEARHGAYLMPFLDHQVVAEALTLPMALKHAGRFEALLLQAIDPALAGHDSAYGHDFARAPSVRHRFDEWSTRIRPAWVRQKSYALQRRLRPMADEHGGIFDPDYMGRVIDLDFPAMRRYFRMENIRDQSVWRRIACLEYLAGHLGSRLVG